jgi:lysyl-tRNA synthetase class 2
MSTHAAHSAPPLRLARTRLRARTSTIVAVTIAALVATFGVTQVFLVENGASGTIVGAGLVALAVPLARGRRRALIAAGVLVAASLVLDVDGRSLATASAIGLLVAMALATPALRATGDPATRRLIVPAAMLLAVGLGADLAHAGGALTHPLAVTLVLAAVFLSIRAVRPWRMSPSADAADRSRAAAIVSRSSADTLAPFALRHDKRYHFTPEGTSFIAYRVVCGVALVSGDPIGEARAFPGLVADFVTTAARRGWIVGVVGASAPCVALWRDVGLNAHYTGDEAIIDPEAFSLEGRAIRKVRQSVTRLEREGYRTDMLRTSEIGDDLAAELSAIAQSWLGNHTETGYSMAFNGAMVDRTREDLYAIARARDGRVRGFLHFGIVGASEGISLSSMRRDRDTPNGLNEYLISRTLAWARDHHVARVSLNFAAFALLLDPPAELDPVSRFERRCLARFGERFQLERLLSFSEKFSPTWTPRYAAYPGLTTLPRVALAAMLAEAYVTLPRPPWRREGP